jgi:hypothetical protein
MNDSCSTLKMAQDDHPTLEYAEILSIVATVLSICMNLLCCVLDVRTAGSWISDRATRLKEQLKAAFEEEATDDEPWWLALIHSYVLCAALCVVFNASYSTAVWVLISFFCVLFAGLAFLWLPRPWRVWEYETIYDWTTWPVTRPVTRPITRPGFASRRSKVEMLTRADMGDRKQVEEKDEVVTDEDYMDDTDDTWSSNLDTPSEPESSHSIDTSPSRNNVRTGRAAIMKASVREATRAGFKPETAASYLDSFILPPTVQDPQKRHPNLQNSPDRSTTNPPPTEPFQTSEQTPFGKNMSTWPGHRWVYQDRPTLTSYVVEKAEHQPLDMIVLQVMQGTDYQEKTLVRMDKTTSFVQLKDKLRKKDEDDSELVVRGPRGDFPVFDNETPLSVSSLRHVLIIVVEGSQMLMFCVFDAIDWFAALEYVGLGTSAGYAEVTRLDWKGLSGECLLECVV